MTDPNHDTGPYEGTFIGGPLDGRTIIARCPDGVLVGDKPTGRAWLYDYRDGAFVVREEQPRQLDADRAVSAALNAGWDVLALPGEEVPGGGE